MNENADIYCLSLCRDTVSQRMPLCKYSGQPQPYALYPYQPSSRIAVANTGSEVVEVKTDSSGHITRLGQNGTGYFDSNSRIQIGDAMISVDRRVEVINTSSDVIKSPITIPQDASKP